MNDTTVSMSSANSIVAYLDRKGYLPKKERQQFLKTVGISESDISSMDQRLPIETYYGLWEKAKKLTNDPAIGLHIGQEHHPDLMSLVSNLWVHSDTAEQGMEQYAEYSNILNTGMRISIKKEADQSVLYFNYLNPDEYHQSDIERTIALNASRARLYLGNELSVAKVTFAHGPTEYINIYHTFFPCPVEFNAPCSSITIRNKYLHRSTAPKNPYVFCALREQAEKIKRSLRINKTTEQVSRIISTQLHVGDIQIEDISNRLHMNRQTLYRKLKSEGQNFKTLVDKIRRAKAIEMMKDRSLSLSEVSYYLGFSETSAFSRAFKRWTGQSPKHYRLSISS